MQGKYTIGCKCNADVITTLSNCTRSFWLLKCYVPVSRLTNYFETDVDLIQDTTSIKCHYQVRGTGVRYQRYEYPNMTCALHGRIKFGRGFACCRSSLSLMPEFKLGWGRDMNVAQYGVITHRVKRVVTQCLFCQRHLYHTAEIFVNNFYSHQDFYVPRT